MKMWLVALLLMSTTHTHADNSALQAVLSQKGLQKVSQVLTDWLQSKISSVALPEVRGDVYIGIGSVDYVLHDMSIQRWDMPKPSVAFSEGTGISLQVNGLSLYVQGSWNTHFGIIDDSGWFEMTVYSISLNTELQLHTDQQRLSITTALCSGNVGSVQVNFHGGASFLCNDAPPPLKFTTRWTNTRCRNFIFQPFVSKFSNRITDMLREKICPAFNQGIEDLEGHLAAMPEAVKLDPFVYMNISLLDTPLVKKSGLELNVKGEFYSIASPSEPPFSPTPFELPWREDYMVSLGASEFCVNSAAYAYQSAGVLQIRITDDMIPKISPIHLNTSQFGTLVPQLPKKYPDMPMVLLLYSSETPLFSFKETVMSVQLLASVKAFALKPDSVAIPLFRLNVESSFSAKAYTDKQLVKGALEMKNLTVTLGSTEIGDFSTTPIEQIVKMAMKMFVLPKVNVKLEAGIQLPYVKGFNISNSVMTIENGFLAIAMDITGQSER